MKSISSFVLKKKLEEHSNSFKLVNALEPSKFRLMHIPKSINLTQRREIEQYLDKEDEIVVYCTNECCFRSRVLYCILKSMGYRKVQRYAGGLKEWCELGFPMEGHMIR